MSEFQSLPAPWEEPGLCVWERNQTPARSRADEKAWVPDTTALRQACPFPPPSRDAAGAGAARGTFGGWTGVRAAPPAEPRWGSRVELVFSLAWEVGCPQQW